MPEKSRVTLCVSSQVGCRQGCVFCHTGRMGLKRHLSAAEIVAQVVVANRFIDENPDWYPREKTRRTTRVSNVVFMGMGEPLDNVQNVAQALEIMSDPPHKCRSQRPASSHKAAAATKVIGIEATTRCLQSWLIEYKPRLSLQRFVPFGASAHRQQAALRG